MPTVAPYGTWTSPFTARRLAEAGISLRAPHRRGDRVFWLEGRPAEAGRTVPVCRSADGAVRDLLPPGWDVRGRVHEYGGGDILHLDDGFVFVNGADQALYRVAGDGAPFALTAAGNDRFGDLTADPRRGWLLAVRERHSPDGTAEPENTIVAVPLDGSAAAGPDGVTVLVSGADFYAAPRPSPDGARLAWIAWNHPDMPWDATELRVAAVNPDGTLGQSRRIAGGPGESVVSPVWLDDGRLVFVSDRSGWWSLFVWDGEAGHDPQPVLTEPVPAAEFARPLWVLGNRDVVSTGNGTLVTAYTRDGLWHLGIVDPAAGRLEPVALPYTMIDELSVDGSRVTFLGAGPAEVQVVATLDLTTRAVTVERRAAAPVEAASVSIPRPIRFPTGDGGVGVAHAFYYPPANKDYIGPRGEKPPLIVRSHGGPTAAAGTAFTPKIQYWTSRGFAVVDVNYRGSTGYGRAYRDALKGAWGVADVADCVAAARFLAAEGLVDPDRLIITGSSAGGYTTLCAVTFHDTFRAGASHYGISDLETLATDTHKFEARYLDSLVGPYPARRDLYVARSPIHAVERLAVPMVFFQGLQDKVVPPDQARRMVDAIGGKGLPVAYVTFAEERHGFRRADSIVAALEGELYFYSRVFGFTPADPLAPIPIRNLG